MPGPKRKAESKRNSDDWVSFTAFIKPETKERMRIALLRTKLVGTFDVAFQNSRPADQSEFVEMALQPFLEEIESKIALRFGEFFPDLPVA